MKKYKIGYTTGVFDMFHIGHLNIIKRAKEQCEYLVVGVTTDELCEKRKNKRPIICQEDRVAIVESIKYVDRVVLYKKDELDDLGKKLHKCFRKIHKKTYFNKERSFDCIRRSPAAAGAVVNGSSAVTAAAV